MFIIALVVYLVFLSIYLGFFWALAYHLRNYQLPGEHLPVIARALVLSMMLLAGFSLIAFLATPWDTITPSFTIGLQNTPKP